MFGNRPVQQGVERRIAKRIPIEIFTPGDNGELGNLTEIVSLLRVRKEAEQQSSCGNEYFFSFPSTIKINLVQLLFAVAKVTFF